MTIKEFLFLEENKKAYWKALNWFMSFGVSFVAFQATDNVAWAVSVLPIAKIASEMFTRYLNNAYNMEK